MTALSFEIREEWSTRLWVGRVAPEADGTSLQELRRLGAALVGAEPESLRWRDRREELDPGSYVGLRFGEGDVGVVVVRASEGSAGQHESGQIVFHDPRVGAGHVSIPGLPWARPVNIPAEAGRAVVFPAWLAHSVAPLHAEHRVRLWWSWGSRSAAGM